VSARERAWARSIGGRHAGRQGAGEIGGVAVRSETVTDLFAVIALGFVLGMRHATDPDHVLAVTTIVARYRAVRSAAFIGLWWGVGHTLTILGVGGGIVLFGWVIPPRLGLSMEFSVGLMLIVLGVATLVSLYRRAGEGATLSAEAGAASGTGHVHSHAHAHGDYVHTHAHSHVPDGHPHEPGQTPLARLDRRFGSLGLYSSLRPLVVGMVHGLAGSAAVALLVLATIRDPRWSVVYLLVFGFGTIAGMMLMTMTIAAPFAWTADRHARLSRGLRLASGVISIGFGCLIAYRLGTAGHLFGTSPVWTPR
jgi:ABC-type nickel/cobalt efflux system permease component RcnA